MSLRLGLFAFVSSGTLVAPLLQSESRLPIEPCVFFAQEEAWGVDFKRITQQHV